MQIEFERFVARVRGPIDARLIAWLEARTTDARQHGADVFAAADALRQLALRGGKRLRAILLAAAYEGCEGEGGAEAVVLAGVALELLQVYLLVHDDWMDGDATRRGGPSVPAMMRGRFGAARADSVSVLAGDLAAAWARQAVLDVPLPPARVLSAAREMARVEEEVVHGQLLDVSYSARDIDEVEAMHALKTASYSVRAPLVMGARLAGAPDSVVAALVDFANPIGVAFQLRDDILGVFGDEATMGKPGGDLRAGKRTAIVVEAMRDGAAAQAVERVFGRSDACAEDVRAAALAIDQCGARDRLESRIGVLVLRSWEALDRAALLPEARRIVERAVSALIERQA